MIGDLPPGTVVGPYKLVSVIGRGGMGVVYLAEDTTLDRRVALKVLAPQYTGDASFRSRFERESRLAAALDHPNVVPIYEAGESDGVLFIAMRYVSGPDLRAVLEREGPFGVTRTLGIAAQLASALDAAHASGLIHRDVKPGNVLLAAGYGADGSEHVYLTDFGLTKHSASKSGLTQLGQLVGTIDYIAPEQISGGAIDGRADLYALGCVVFEMLAKRAPFVRDTDLATMAAHLHEPPPQLTPLRPDLPPTVDAFVAKALAKNPDDRFASGKELVRAARTALIGQTTESAAPSMAAPTTISTVPAEAGAATVLVSAAAVPPPPTSTPPPPTSTPPAPTSTQPAQTRYAGPPPTVVPPPVAPSSYSGPPPGQSNPAAGQTPPPYVPVAPPPAPPGGTDRRPLIIGVAMVVGLLLVAAVAFAFVSNGSPTASPTPGATFIAALPSSVGLPSPSPAASVAPTALSSVPPSSAPTLAPTLAPTEAPTAVPTAAATPTSGPTLPPTAYEAMLAQLQPSVAATCTQITSPSSAWKPVPIALAQCTDSSSTITRTYARFSSTDDLKAAFDNFLNGDAPSRNRCPGFTGGTWNYQNDPQTETRGEVVCYNNSNSRPQLNFSFDSLALLGVVTGGPRDTKATVTTAWDNNDGIDSSVTQ